MRYTDYATNAELRKILNKWKKSSEKLSMKELKQIMFCVEDYLATSDASNSSWDNCSPWDIGWG